MRNTTEKETLLAIEGIVTGIRITILAKGQTIRREEWPSVKT
jgi:hypothetical protein